MKIQKGLIGGCLFLMIAFNFMAIDVVNGQNDGHANPRAIIREGNARFTILTPHLVRLEWDSTGQFNDRPSFVVINRKLEVPFFKQTIEKGWLHITTSEIELSYQLQSGKFTENNLQIIYRHPQGNFVWKPGMKEKGNLKGTYRTLDGFDGNEHLGTKEIMKLEDGLLSTDGWHLIDDSRSLLFDNSEWPWVLNRAAGDVQDWYFMGYGKSYKQALYDYSLVAGKVPLPPRYAFGYWWSRYWSYSDNEIHDLVNNFEKYSIPLDVLVIDMDWHKVVNEHQPWTGWTWNNRLFPDPDKSLAWIKSKNLKTTLNLHPAEGIAPYESQYPAFAKAMNFDTTTHASIPYEASNKKYMNTLFNTVLHPMEKKGVDFWWLDWQQWPMDKKIPNLSNTWWLNYTFFSDKERNSDKRPLIYHRWGGLGNHRYQIGFSGDAVISWKTLDYEPYFTNCASNVLYSYWSHDIGGHQFSGNKNAGIDPEMYTRWMQYGSLSPIFRTHSTKNATINKEIWNFRGEAYNALTNSINFRYQLSPYIYTMARKTYDSAIGLCRPLYYDYPNQKESYSYNKQYMFGDNILVAPIGAPMENGESKLSVWLPTGNDWYEWNTGTLLPGGQMADRSFTLEEYPVYVKAGSVIPMYDGVKNLDKDPGKAMVGVFPGGNGTAVLYEDAGNDKNYAREYATTQLESKWQNRTQRIVIQPRKGVYKGMPAYRTYSVKLYGSEMPQLITINGKTINYTQIPNNKDWSYDGKTLSVAIPLPVNLCSARQEVVIQYSKTETVNVNTGLIKLFRELSKTTTGLKYRDAQLIVPEVIGNCEETNLKLQYDPSKFYDYIQYFKDNYPRILSAIKKTAISGENKDWFIEQLKLKK
jgi:alpha-glucosidase (family GH31 glycosyl hydrolase)